MLNLLIVSDNPLFIQKAYTLFQKHPSFTVHLVFQSTAVFEAYVEYPSQVVLIDSDAFLPFPSIINQFHNINGNAFFLLQTLILLPRPTQKTTWFMWI